MRKPPPLKKPAPITLERETPPKESRERLLSYDLGTPTRKPGAV